MGMTILVMLLLAAAFIFMCRHAWKAIRYGVWPKAKALVRLLRAGSPVKLGLDVVKAAWRGRSPRVSAHRWHLRLHRALFSFIDVSMAADATMARKTTDLNRALGCVLAAGLVLLMIRFI